jgi:hypothetical protein
MVLALIAGAACSDTPAQPLDPVVGHFIGPAWASIEPKGYYLAISLTKPSGTDVTGTGWLAGLSYPAIPLQVTGTYEAPNLDLALTGTDGSPFASLTGLVSQAGVTGEWTRGGASLPLQLARVDTNATATYQATLAGAFSLNQQGAAGFTFRPSFNQTTLWLGWPNSGYPLFAVEWTGPPLVAGTYDLAPSAGFQNAAVFPTGAFELRFNVVRGSLTLDISTEYAMIGYVSVQAKEDSGTRVLMFEGNFSAGCAGLPCRP